MRNYTECSVTFWVNILGWQSNWDTFFQAGLGTAPWNSYIFGVLRNSGSSVVFTISDASSSSQGNYKSSDLTLNTWYHLGFTYKSGHCCIYVNGNLYKDYSTNIIPNFSGINYISLGQLGNASNYQTNCKMNDVRIYDHALSPLEVKQISQGLILHYPLSDKYLEDTTNLVTGITAGGQTTVNNNVVTTSGVDKDTYFSINLSENIVVGTQYTFSCDAEIPSGTWRFPLGNQDNTTLDFVLHNGHNVYSFVANDTNWGTKRLFMDDMGGATNSARSTGLKTKIYNFQLEKKDHETGFAGYGVSRTNSIVYDTSGYGNNGTPIGSFSVDKNTPKYNVSTVFNGNNNIIKANYLPEETKTISIWLKTIWDSASGYQLAVHDKKSGLAIGFAGTQLITYIGSTNGGSGSRIGISNKYIANRWNHIVVIKTGDTTRDVYINGELITPSGGNWWGGDLEELNIGGRHINGSYSAFFNGLLSDFRAYATALSAEDVKSLYNNSAYIDNQGNIYGAVYEEV